MVSILVAAGGNQMETVHKHWLITRKQVRLSSVTGGTMTQEEKVSMSLSKTNDTNKPDFGVTASPLLDGCYNAVLFHCYSPFLESHPQLKELAGMFQRN